MVRRLHEPIPAGTSVLAERARGRRTRPTPPSRTLARPCRRPGARERGQSTVELALVLPLLALVIFGCLKVGIAFFSYEQVASAANAAARAAAVNHGADPTVAARAAAKSISPTVGLSDAQIAVNYVSTASPPGAAWSYPGTVTVDDHLSGDVQLLGAASAGVRPAGERDEEAGAVMRARLRRRARTVRRRVRAVRARSWSSILYVVVQFGQVYLQYQEVSAATSEGARRASTMAGIADPGRTSTITSTVRAGTSVGTSEAFDPTDLAVTVNSTWTPGSPVTVTSTYPASVSILGVTLFSGTLTTRADRAGPQLMSRLRALRRGEDGQALVFSVLMLAALLGIASLVVDGGNALLQRRNQQGVADAAAMAAVKDLPASTITADTTARSYATTQNSADASIVDQVVVTGTRRARATADSAASTLAPASVCVVVHTDTQGAFSRLLGLDIWKESARAIAQASQVTGVGGWLPFGVRSGAFTDDPPTQLTITPGDQSHNVGGAVNTPAGPDCKFYGGDQISDVIKSATPTAAPTRARSRSANPSRPRPASARQHHQQGLRRAHRQQHRLLQRRLRPGRERQLLRQEARLAARSASSPSPGHDGQLAALRQRDDHRCRATCSSTSATPRKPPNYPAYSGNGSKLTIYLTPVNAPLPDLLDGPARRLLALQPQSRRLPPRLLERLVSYAQLPRVRKLFENESMPHPRPEM